MQNATALEGEDQAASCQQPVDGLTLQEAAAILGVSLGKVRRQISAGQIQAERIERPQGYVWRVYLDGRQQATQDAEQPPTSTLPQDAGSVPQPPGTDIMR